MRLPPLYAIVDPLDTGRDPAALAAALLRGGARVVQLRWPEASARELLAAALAIGPLARAAEAAGADYIGVGPVYATTTKSDALAPRGLALVSAVRATVRCPLVAIGGITAETAPAVR